VFSSNDTPGDEPNHLANCIVSTCFHLITHVVTRLITVLIVLFSPEPCQLTTHLVTSLITMLTVLCLPQCIKQSKFIMPIESPYVVPYLTSFKSDISVTILKICDTNAVFSWEAMVKINSTYGLSDKNISDFCQKWKVATSPESGLYPAGKFGEDRSNIATCTVFNSFAWQTDTQTNYLIIHCLNLARFCRIRDPTPLVWDPLPLLTDVACNSSIPPPIYEIQSPL